MILFIRLLLSAVPFLFANPYPDPTAVPKDKPYLPSTISLRSLSAEKLREEGVEVVRVSVLWSESGEKYEISEAVVEKSGSLAVVRRATQKDKLGSFRGELQDSTLGLVYDDTIGTGTAYRKLVREFTFRFPRPQGSSEFRFFAENPQSGHSELVLSKTFASADFAPIGTLPEVEVRQIGNAATSSQLILNIYADGYTASRKEAFFTSAKKTVDVLERSEFPGFAKFAFRAVFSESNTKLGSAKDLGLPVAEKDSFLGLYFPYWFNFGRWYNVVYPTRESRFRRGLATVPYDYAVVLLDDSDYWGVGNFRELTAIPANASQFTYLLTHEFGHFFGLNEEYEGGGPTELEFAPGIDEPWSQNITFLRDPKQLKWQQHVSQTTPVPTPASYWKGSGPFGAYKGGYADSEPAHQSNKPGHNCTMKNGSKFCPVCHQAINDRIKYDLGN